METENLIVKRGRGRPPNRANHVERAEVREPFREAPRLKRRMRSGEDRYKIPPEFIPDGMSWEFKRCLIGGKEDQVYQSELAMNYWEPVLAETNPEVAARYGIKKGAIFVGDMMLMQRPSYLTDEANEEIKEMTISRQESIRSSLKDAPAGHFARNHPKVAPQIRKTYESVEDNE